MLLVATLPAVIIPFITGRHAPPSAPMATLFNTIFPLYVVVAAALSWLCMRSGRSIMAWILLIIMMLTDGAMLLLQNT